MMIEIVSLHWRLRKRTLKQTLYYVLISFLGLLLASCTRVVHRAENQPFRLPNGLSVQPIRIETSDLSQTLEVKMWKFKVTPPKPNSRFNCSLELHQRGRRPTPLA